VAVADREHEAAAQQPRYLAIPAES
jgi:hypothetical protein